jgi:hypothetical protein
MAAQSEPKKLPRLNWRERLPDWIPGSRPQLTGSETDNKPVSGETGSEIVRQPVMQQTGSTHVSEPVEPEPVCPKPVSDEDLRAWLEALSPTVHAQHLLAWLQAKGYGGQSLMSVSVRDNAYPKLCAEHDWEPLPWHGPQGVGKHLALLCGGRPIRPGPNGKPSRGYAIPAAVVDLATERRRA